MLSAWHDVSRTDCVMMGWRKSGILDAWDDEKRKAAVRHNLLHQLFKRRLECAVPSEDEPCIIRPYDEDDDEDEPDEYANMSDTEAEEEEEEEGEEQATISIATTREKRTSKPAQRYSS